MTGFLRYYGGADDVRCCPTTKKFLHETDRVPGVFTAWGVWGHPDYFTPIPVWVGEGMYGSYGANGLAHNPLDEGVDGTYDITSLQERAMYWRKRARVRKKLDIMPLLADAFWDGSEPLEDNTAPPWKAWTHKFNGMSNFCVPRHNGKVNTMFMDLSMRKVGLKELWTLNWHTKWDTPRLSFDNNRINEYPD